MQRLSDSAVRSMVFACVLVGAAACGGGGGGGGGGGSGATGPNYFPVDANARWVYTSTDSALPPGRTSTSLTVHTGTQPVAGQTAQVFRTRARGLVSNDLYVVSEQGVRNYLTEGDPVSAALSGLQVMVFPIEPGAVYDQLDITVDSGVDYDGDGRSDRVRLRVTLTVIGFESVNTPLGTFGSALHQHQRLVETVLPSGGSPAADFRADNDSWYVDGVGLVRSSTTVSGGGQAGTTTDALAGYRIGTRTTDAIPPTLTSTKPQPGTVRSVGTVISALFSEPMDPDSLLSGGITVVGPNGPVTSVTIDVEGSEVLFQPIQWLPTGTYTATVQGSVTDLLGNALGAPRSWTFTADGSEPVIASAAPADGAKDVPLDTSLVVVFNEPLDPATVNSVSVQLWNDTGSVPVTMTFTGSTLTLTPKAPLEQAMTYRLVMNGVTDLVGNFITEQRMPSFQTTQGAFAYPVDLPHPKNAAFVVSAIGDVNGDGIADVLLASTGTGTAEDGLYVLAGRADGTLAVPARIDVGASLGHCVISSIAVGDLDGDGRADVAIGGNYCGVQVLHQTLDGKLAVGEYLSPVTSDVVRIADLDGNGKNALLGVGGGIAAVTIWRRDGTGTMVFSESLATGAGSGVDLQVGDIDGDGRADVVVATQGFLGKDVTVFHQGAGHVFAPPTYLSVDAVWGARSVAIGDLNGDGRRDVVATTGGNRPTSMLIVYYQDAAGGLGPASPVATYDIPVGVRIADLDGDGRADIVVEHAGFPSVSVYLQRAGGTLGAEQRYVAPSGSFLPDALSVGDVTGDGKPDIIVNGALIRHLSGAGSMSLTGRAHAAVQRLMTSRSGR